MPKDETPAKAAPAAAPAPRATAPASEPAGEPAGGWPRDNYTGHYGRFNRDPVTGVRSPADDETRQAMQALGIVSATELAPPAG